MFFWLRNSILTLKSKFGQLEAAGGQAIGGHPDPGRVLILKYDDVYQNIYFLGSETQF